MSGFSPAWLALREPADSAARSSKVMDACARHFSAHASLNICDLGAGTGSSVRAFSPLLPKAQRWTLIDNDASNLAEAKVRHPEIYTDVRDFADDPACWPGDTQLVTTTALLDLTSRRWIDQFVAALADARLPLLATLTVDGKLSLTPQHTDDTGVFNAFGAHQHGDKGFGPALGGEAAAYLEKALKAARYNVIAEESPWRLKPGELLRQTLDGIANAVRETGRVTAIDAWLESAQSQTALLTIGHRDVFATPG